LALGEEGFCHGFAFWDPGGGALHWIPGDGEALEERSTVCGGGGGVVMG